MLWQEGEAVRQLPSNAQFVQMDQQCAWGMLGSFFNADIINLKSFGSFIVVTSLVRGALSTCRAAGACLASLHAADLKCMTKS